MRRAAVTRELFDGGGGQLGGNGHGRSPQSGWLELG